MTPLCLFVGSNESQGSLSALAASLMLAFLLSVMERILKPWTIIWASAFATSIFTLGELLWLAQTKQLPGLFVYYGILQTSVFVGAIFVALGALVRLLCHWPKPRENSEPSSNDAHRNNPPGPADKLVPNVKQQMRRVLPKFTAGLVSAVTTLWIGYEFAIRDQGIAYFAAKSPGFWFMLALAIVGIAVTSLVVGRRFGTKLSLFLMEGAAGLLLVLTLAGAATLIWITSNRDLPIEAKEIVTFSGVLILLAFLATVCWIAAAKARKRSAGKASANH